MKLSLSFLSTDPRTTDWPLMSTPWPVLGLVSLYLVIVIFGPRLMMNREAFHINSLLMVYNFGLVLLSFYMFSEVGAACQIKFTTVQELDRNVTLSQNISCLAWRRTYSLELGLFGRRRWKD